MSQLAPGRVLSGRYRLDSLIARGGMATVWLGRDELLGRRVAVKTLHPELAHDAALRGRFRQEAVAAAALSHPNIVATYDTGDDEGTAFIVMELVDGESLRQVLDRRGVLDPPEACAIAHQVATALEHAHRQGIVHRDVKPANVLVPGDGPVKVTDFGIAKAAGGSDFTRTGTVVGTARYLSPEQVQGFPADARTDVYALGLVLYEMLTGKPAYAGDTEMATAVARLAGPPKPMAQIRPGISPALSSVVDQALQADPSHRIPSAARFDETLHRAETGVLAPPRTGATATALRHASSTTGSTAVTAMTTAPATRARSRAAPATSRPATRPKPRRRWGAAGILLFLLFLAALGVAAGLVTAWLVSEDSGGAGGGGTTETSGAAGSAATGRVRDFDPEGDGQENPSAVAFALDGNVATAWQSETYETRNLGGLKPGVGLVVELDAPFDVSEVTIQGEPGADVEVYVADEAGESIDDWEPVRGRATNVSAEVTIPVDPRVRAGAVLVWFTRTPPSGRIEVRELRVA